jgi:DNA-binding GntR family transcriptional regulator
MEEPMGITAATAVRGGSERDVTRVTDGIRDAIVAGDFVPDQRLVEADLADRFQASRATVRASLLTLSNRGLVTLSQNRGARVRKVSLGEAIEITEVRAAIEGLCAAKLAERNDPAVGRELQGIATAMRAAVEELDVVGYSELNRRLHATIIGESRHATAAAEIDRLNAQIVRRQYRLAMRPGRIQRSIGEHEAIIEAIVAGDAAAAESALRGHLGSVIDALKAAGDGDA